MIDTSKARLGMTRREMKETFGEPNQIGIGSRKYPAPGAYRYGQIEFGFGPRWEDGLCYVMDVGESGLDHIVILTDNPRKFDHDEYIDE